MTLDDFALVAQVSGHGCEGHPNGVPATGVRLELYELSRCGGCGVVLAMKRVHFPALPPVPRSPL